MSRAWDVPGLRRKCTFRDAAGRVIVTRWREMMSYRDGTLLGEDIEELHAMRVSSRRLRSAMDAFAVAFPKKAFTARLRTVKAITDTLGRARDLDVQIDGFTAMLETVPPDEQPGIAGMIRDLQAQREAETPSIAALFERLERERFAERFEGWVARHTGVEVDRLEIVPPAP